MRTFFDPFQLVIVSALTCEARPWIDSYRLQKVCDSPFQLFAAADSEVAVLISGIGALNAASSIAWLGGQIDETLCWLNIGAAGHESYEQGEIYRVAAVQSDAEERLYYPPLTAQWAGDLPQQECLAACRSLSNASSDYPASVLIDMEAYAFFQITKKFSPAELCASLKVVSDNPKVDLASLNAKSVQALVQPHCELVVTFIEKMIKLSGSGMVKSPVADYQLERFKGSHSTQSQLRQEIDNAIVLLGEEWLLSFLADSTEQAAKNVLQTLQSHLLSVQPSLDDARLNPARS